MKKKKECFRKNFMHDECGGNCLKCKIPYEYVWAFNAGYMLAKKEKGIFLKNS